jgi:hypothetical protein
MKKSRTKKKLKWMIPLLSVGICCSGPVLATANGALDPAIRELPSFNGGVEFFEEAFAVTVRGRVTSQGDDLGLPGVTVLEKGTNNGTVTDIDGAFTIEVTGENSILVFSYVGFESQEVRVGNQTNINISLQESIAAMSEVVVTALGIEREKRSLGYSVGEVKGDDIRNVTQENAINALAGRVAGVSINPSTPASMLEEILPDVDLVLVMSVNPGFGGQEFIHESLAKIRRIRDLLAARGFAGVELHSHDYQHGTSSTESGSRGQIPVA